MSNANPGTPPEPAYARALDALRELDVELGRLSRADRTAAELRATVAALLDSIHTATPHDDGTTTLVVGTDAWQRLRTAAGAG
ncbi:hypothetical protein [Yinghuangia seranimata]|uniref:hypothetical protein n=1 Tax=Yinghuangia seranimata TaxID=408067 RepID=UPI00248CEF28|nr:hypothetical protein [Yinghuangia seranimata]MDI2127415.1 hypothetical protein [Yinghuangia seranimata]